MAYDPTRPKDDDFVKQSAGLIRENFEGLRTGGIVLAKPPLYGVGTPSAALGENGEQYIDTLNGNHYYKNSTSRWEKLLVLDGIYANGNAVSESLDSLTTTINKALETKADAAATNKALEAKAQQTDLDALAAKIVTPTAYVTSVWKANDGSSWFRIWSDGFVEQGWCLNVTALSMTAYLPKPLTTTTYNVSATAVYSGNATSTVSIGTTKTTSYFTVYTTTAFPSIYFTVYGY